MANQMKYAHVVALAMFGIAFSLYLIGWSGVVGAFVVGFLIEIVAWVLLLLGGSDSD